jgi:hypothetical protein
MVQLFYHVCKHWWISPFITGVLECRKCKLATLQEQLELLPPPLKMGQKNTVNHMKQEIQVGKVQNRFYGNCPESEEDKLEGGQRTLASVNTSCYPEVK